MTGKRGPAEEQTDNTEESETPPAHSFNEVQTDKRENEIHASRERRKPNRQRGVFHARHLDNGGAVVPTKKVAKVTSCFCLIVNE